MNSEKNLQKRKKKIMSSESNEMNRRDRQHKTVMKIYDIGIATMKYCAICMALGVIFGLASDASSFNAYRVACDVFMIIAIILFLFNLLLLIVHASWEEDPESFKEFGLRIIKLIAYPVIVAIIALAIIGLLTAIAP